jgi:hypothetical protein
MGWGGRPSYCWGFRDTFQSSPRAPAGLPESSGRWPFHHADRRMRTPRRSGICSRLAYSKWSNPNKRPGMSGPLPTTDHLILFPNPPHWLPGSALAPSSNLAHAVAASSGDAAKWRERTWEGPKGKGQSPGLDMVVTVARAAEVASQQGRLWRWRNQQPPESAEGEG